MYFIDDLKHFFLQIKKDKCGVQKYSPPWGKPKSFGVSLH